MKRPKIIILVGPSGSGKSTWAKNYISEPKNKKTVIVSRDDIRNSVFGEIDQSYYKSQSVITNEGLVSEISDRQISACLFKGFDVIADNTHLRLKYIRKYEKFDAELRIVYFNCDAVQLIYRVVKRERDGRTSEQDVRDRWSRIIKNQVSRYEQLRENHTEDINRIVEMSLISDKKRRYVLEETIQSAYSKPVDRFKPKAVLCDLDGTLAIMGDRSPYHGEACKVDIINSTLHTLLKKYQESGYRLILLSGRNGSSRMNTEKWLKDNGVRYDRLIMRGEEDYRRDVVVKKEIYENCIENEYQVEIVFDDRNSVVDMWRDLGLVCFQVNKGDF